MKPTVKPREKRFITDIGKDSNDLLIKLKSISGNKKLTKKEIIYRALEYSFNNRLNFKETPEKSISKKDLAMLEKNLFIKMEFYNKEINEILAPLKRIMKK